MIRVRMVKTLAPVEIPNGTLGTWQREDFGSGMARVAWDNGYVIPMYRNEVEVVNEA
jgi:hypothetical protein